jgi:hypothetical protein
MISKSYMPWIENPSVVVSINADLFMAKELRILYGPMLRWIKNCCINGNRLVVDREHSEIFNQISISTEYVLNFDYHMDVRIEYMLGAEPLLDIMDLNVF